MGFFACFRGRQSKLEGQIDALISVLTNLSGELKIMATTLAQLDAALAALSPAITQLTTDVTALIAKLGTGADFTSELTSVQASLASLQGLDTTVQGAIAPPAAPHA